MDSIPVREGEHHYTKLAREERADYNKGSIIDIAPRLYLILSFGGNDRNWLLYFSSGSSPVFLVITKSSV